MRLCDLCGVVDDGPRHVIAHGPGTVPVDDELLEQVSRLELSDEDRQAALLAVVDTTLNIRHISCCAADGCALCTTTQED